MNQHQFHTSVLLKEVLENLKPQDNEIYIDGTFGAGGYSRAILESANCAVYGFDRDYSVKKFADVLGQEFKDRFHFIHSPFAEMLKMMAAQKIDQVDGIVLDLGVSSMQLDEEGRGFSFSSSAKLDMRMDDRITVSAFEVVNEMSEADLTKIIRDFGEEKKSRIIAKKIVEKRQFGPITSCLDLAEIVKKVYGWQVGKIHPATKTFQAIRIFVNDELGQLRQALQSAKQLLRTGGRLVVVSFHSLEDSMVKSFLREESGYNDRNISRYQPVMNQSRIHSFSLPKGSAIKPGEDELKNNIRSRSSRLRVAIKN